MPRRSSAVLVPSTLCLSLAAASLPIAAAQGFFSLIGVEGTAHAQGMDADTREAKVLFEDGVRLYKDGKYEDARVKFKAAYGLKKRPSIILNLAHAELLTRRPLDAATHFREALALPDLKADDHDDAMAGLADARKHLGVIEIDAPAGSTVTIDGESRGTVPMEPIDVISGTHAVTIKVPSGKQTAEKITLFGGQATTIKAHADEPAPTTPVPTDTTPEPTPPEAAADTTPVAKTETPSTSDTTSSEDAPPRHVRDSRERRGFFASVHPITYVSAGVLVVSPILSYVFYNTYKTHKTNVNLLATYVQDNPNDPQLPFYKSEGRQEVDDANRDALYSNIFLGVTAVAFVATVVTGFALYDSTPSNPSRSSSVSWNVTAAPMRDGGGVFLLSGTF